MTGSHETILTPLGIVEPHTPLLTVPTDDQLLYKRMSVERLLQSIGDNYLHFNRVNNYIDFMGADPHDGEQLPQDRAGNGGAKFLKAPDFSASDYYDQSRARTYACCFSLDPSFISNNSATGSAKGTVCVVFNFGKLRARLNAIIGSDTSKLHYNGIVCQQIFSINYGVVEYIDWDRHQANAAHLPNPIKYTYLKGLQFRGEREFRISLSAFGLGNFALADGSIIAFPASLRMPFYFGPAIGDGTIKEINCAADCDSKFLLEELHKLRIMPAPASAP